MEDCIMPRAKVVSFINMKGGVAKTTLCINIGYTLAKQGKKVLVIDMDPQFNATQTLVDKFNIEYGNLRKNKKTIFYLFNDEDDTSPNFIDGKDEEVNHNNLVTKLTDNLDMICGDLDLIKIESSERGRENKLNIFIHDETRQLAENYDLILIDSPPTFSFYTIASLLASDYYLIPVKPDYYSLLGVGLVKQIMRRIYKNHNKKLKCLGLIYTLIQGNSVVHNPIMEAFEESEINEYIFANFLKQKAEVIRGAGSGKLMFDIGGERKKEIEEMSEEFCSQLEAISI